MTEETTLVNSAPVIPAKGVAVDEQSREIILASSSPRRLDLLRSLGLSFAVMPSHIDEEVEHAGGPDALVVDLALAKARAVAKLISSGASQITASVRPDGRAAGNSDARGNCLVLGADTVVVLDGEVLGKPSSESDACAMLARLSGRAHDVYTGVALLDLASGTEQCCQVVSRVTFRKMQTAEIEAYVSTGEPMDKAGAYALQGTGSAFVERIDGCFTNVIGLPIPHVVQLLRRAGVAILGLPRHAAC